MNSLESKSGALDGHEMSIDALRLQLDAAREREREIAAVLGSDSPDQILHDVRNLLNEVQLLRLTLAEAEQAK